MDDSSFIILNVGGTTFATTRTTLTSIHENDQTYFAKILITDTLKDLNGFIFIDRSPKYFEHILNYLRDGTVDDGLQQCELNNIKCEAKFYNLKNLISIIEEKNTTPFLSFSKLLFFINFASETWISGIWCKLYKFFTNYFAKKNNNQWNKITKLFKSTYKMLEHTRKRKIMAK